MMELDNGVGKNACIKVVGVGGAGGNVINTMIEEQVEGVDFLAVNTDLQALSINFADTKLQIGETKTRGLGAGSNPSVGREAAIESQSLIQEHLTGADMVFITAGMGGGTGTGAAPVVAELARKNGALTVGVVTKPFAFEGKRRRRQAEEGLEVLRSCVDTLIVIPNERLLQVVGEGTSLEDSFKQVDSVLLNAVRSISDVIVKPGFINTDFADVRTVMSNKGIALMGTGVATGPERAIEAAELAINSPLLDDITIKGATSVLLNITSPRSVSLAEISAAARLIEEEASDDVHLIYGHVFSEGEDDDEFKVTVIATGFEDQHQEEAAKPVLAAFHNPAVNSHIGGYHAGYSENVKSGAEYNSMNFMPQQSKAGAFAPVAQANYVANPNYQPAFVPQAKQNLPEAMVDPFIPQLNQQPASSYAPQTPKQSFLPIMGAEPALAQNETNTAIKDSLGDLASRPQSVSSGLSPEEELEIDKPAFMRKGASRKFFAD
ncbi:MAG: cell division protein FtsZ [Bradymonadales bacterium]|jgi:cell division protein FtsZ